MERDRQQRGRIERIEQVAEALAHRLPGERERGGVGHVVAAREERDDVGRRAGGEEDDHGADLRDRAAAPPLEPHVGQRRRLGQEVGRGRVHVRREAQHEVVRG